MSRFIPTGHFHESHCVFGDLGKDAVLCKAYDATFPDITTADDLTGFESDIRLLLASVKDGERIQVHSWTNNEFTVPLKRFHADTVASNPPEFCREVRHEYFERFSRRKEEQTLIQSSARIYLSSKLPSFVKDNGKKVRGFDEVFRVVSRSFANRESFFNVLLRPYGGGVTGLDDLGHYRDMRSYWSPAHAGKPVPEGIDWLRTIPELCQHSEVCPREGPYHGFYLDGHFFGLFVAKIMPRSTHALTMDSLFALSVPGVRVVVNAEPLSVDAEIAHEQSEFEKLMSNLDVRSPSLQCEVGLEKHRERMRRLLSNRMVPFKGQVIVIAHDRSPDDLENKLEGIRAALGKAGFTAYQPTLKTSCLAYFNAATPGYGPWVKYPDYRHKIDDLNLANLIPACSTAKGDLDQADIITEGDNNQVVGFRNFAGSQPLHMLLVGPNGSGKSVTGQVWIIQGALRFKFICVIDDGLSYESACRRLDPRCTPIILRANGDLTFNLFDTNRLPKTPQQIADATALSFLLVGEGETQREDKLTQAVLAETITEIYDAAYETWQKDHPHDHYLLCKEALALLRFRDACMDSLTPIMEVFTESRERLRNDPEALLEFQDGIDNAAIQVMNEDPENRDFVKDLAFSKWTPEMFPTLRDLKDELHGKAVAKLPHHELCGVLASLLRKWLRTGTYGPLLDGPSNVDLGSSDVQENDPLKVVYFELGEIGKSSRELKAVAGFLITHHVRRHIEMMPRRIRKQLILEELTSVMEIPDGEDMVRAFYEKMRKYQCQVISVFQQWGSIAEPHPRAAKAIMGGSLSLVLLRNNLADLEAINASKRVKLPSAIMHRIASFPQPEAMAGRADQHSGFVHVNLLGSEPVCTVGRIVLSKDLEDVVTSSGNRFDEKKRALKKKGPKIIEIEQAA
jgi:hypothetical protein